MTYFLAMTHSYTIIIMMHPGIALKVRQTVDRVWSVSPTKPLAINNRE